MLRRIIALLRKEFLSILNNRQSRLLVIVPPLIQLLMFGYAVTMEVKNIEIGIVDKCRTVESRELIAGFASSRWFSKVVPLENTASLRQAVDNQDIDCALIINEDFSRKLKQNTATAVYLILDGRQINSASIINVYVNNIISNYAQSYNNLAPPIEIVIRNWFNPNLDYQQTILAAVFTMLSTLPCLLLTSMSIAREKELGTFEQLTVSPLTSTEILIGKILPPFIIAFAVSILLTGLMRLIFAMPFVGSLWLLIISIAISLVAVSGIGIFISSICKTQQQALLGVFAYQMPAILLSGFISPVEDMPWLMQQLNYFNPMRYYVVISKGLFLKDMSCAAVFSNLWPLACIALITMSVAVRCFKSRLQ